MILFTMFIFTIMCISCFAGGAHYICRNCGAPRYIKGDWTGSKLSGIVQQPVTEDSFSSQWNTKGPCKQCGGGPFELLQPLKGMEQLSAACKQVVFSQETGGLYGIHVMQRGSPGVNKVGECFLVRNVSNLYAHLGGADPWPRDPRMLLIHDYGLGFCHDINPVTRKAGDRPDDWHYKEPSVAIKVETQELIDSSDDPITLRAALHDVQSLLWRHQATYIETIEEHEKKTGRVASRGEINRMMKKHLKSMKDVRNASHDAQPAPATVWVVSHDEQPAPDPARYASYYAQPAPATDPARRHPSYYRQPAPILGASHDEQNPARDAPYYAQSELKVKLVDPAPGHQCIIL